MPNVIKFGGGTSLELLWENPNPTSAITSPITVNMDMTKYDRVFVSLKPAANANEPILVEHLPNSNWVSVHTYADTWMSYRRFTRNDTQFSIGTDSGYVYHDGGHASGGQYAIPVAVYGSNGINV